MPWNEPGSGNSGDQDPWGSKNRKGDSPDIDDVISNIRKRFGGNGNKGGFSPFLIVLVLGAFFWLMQCFYQVDEGHQSIELRFGKLKQTVGPGLQFVFWPFEDKIVINTQEVRTVEIGYRDNLPEVKEALMLTRDQNIVDVTMAVQYTIKSIESLVFNVGELGQAGGLDRVVRGATESVLREVVGQTQMDDLLTTERAAVDTKTQDLLQRILDRYESGIQIESIEIQDAKPPKEVRGAFDDVVKADQDRETYINQARAYANRLVPIARGESERIVQEAEAYKARVIAEASGEAERFNKIMLEYQKAPEITKKRLYIETMEQVLGESSKVMIDQKSGGGNSLMYLPIDKIIENQSNRGSRPSVGNSNAGGSSVTIESAVKPKSQTIDEVRPGGHQ